MAGSEISNENDEYGIDRYIKELKLRVGAIERTSNRVHSCQDYEAGMSHQQRKEAELERLASAYIKQLEARRGTKKK